MLAGELQELLVSQSLPHVDDLPVQVFFPFARDQHVQEIIHVAFHLNP